MIEHLSMLDNNYGWSNYQFFVIAFTKYEKKLTKQKYQEQLVLLIEVKHVKINKIILKC